jgi:hypothetical protein
MTESVVATAMAAYLRFRGCAMQVKNEERSLSVVVRQDGSGAWSIALPHAERPHDVFVTFVKDEEEGMWLASQMQPEFRIIVETAV